MMAGEFRSRPWQEIAKELNEATDPQRIAELTEELTQALDKQAPDRSQQPEE